MSASDLALVLRKTEVASVKLEYSVPPLVSGPIALGAQLGQITVLSGDEVMTRMGVVSPVAVGTGQVVTAVPLPAVDEHG